MGQSATSKIFRSASKMASATMASRILGLVREQLIAAYFGASGLTDAFTIAYRIPNMLRDLFAEGAFSSSFVPVFTGVFLKSEEEARRLMRSAAILLGLITCAISILIIWQAESIVLIMTKDVFSSDSQRLLITTNLVRIMAPFLVLVSMAALVMGVLNTLKIFFIPSFAPASFNLLFIGCILVVTPILQARGLPGIYALACGVILGGISQLAIQLPLLMQKGFMKWGSFDWWNSDLSKIVKRVGIGTVGIAATQINIIITTILASGTEIGAVSWLTFGFRLFQFPVGILSVSLAGSNLVHFSDSWKQGHKQEARETLKSSYSFSWLALLPATILLWCLADWAVYLIFQRGAFDASDTYKTTMALQAYAVGLPFYGLYKIFAPTFFAIDRPKVPVFISIIAITVNIVFCVALTPYWGFQTLAWGTSLSMLLNCFLQSLLLRRHLQLERSFFIDGRLIKIILASVVMLGATIVLKESWTVATPQFLTITTRFVAISLSALVAYVLSLILLGEESASRLLKIFKKTE